MDEKIRLLLVEDDATLAGVISDVLSESGFDVVLANNGVEALEVLEAEDEPAPKIIVTDIMMPKMDGFTMVSKIRERGCETPVLFLSARSSAEDVVKGFKLGAGDYIRKPFSMKELVVRIRSLLDRYGYAASYKAGANAVGVAGHSSNAAEAGAGTSSLPGTAENPFRIGRYRFDSVHRRLWLVAEETTALADGVASVSAEEVPVNGGSNVSAGEVSPAVCVQLPTMESEILGILCRGIGTVVPNSFILKKLWGHDDYFSTRSLNVHITRLRKRLHADSSVSIDSFRGHGYRLSV